MTAPRTRQASFAYQPALDGLRAVAVSMVLLFHQGWLRGGYVGVSVFFTLSGYLITSLALTEHERTGRLDVGGFYARRLRRLLPASLACLAAIVAPGRVRPVRRRRAPPPGPLRGPGPGLQLGRPVERPDLRPARRRRRAAALARRPLLVAGDRGAVLLGLAARPRRRPAPRSPPPGAHHRHDDGGRRRRRAADRRGVGARRGVLGDAGPPGRDPRRGARRRRAARPPPGPHAAARRGLGRRRRSRPSWSGRRSRGRARPARPTRAGCRCSPSPRPPSWSGCRSPRRCARPCRSGRSSPWARSATASTSCTGRCTSCSRPTARASPPLPLFVLRMAVTMPIAVVSYRLLEQPIRTRAAAPPTGPAGGGRSLRGRRRRWSPWSRSTPRRTGCARAPRRRRPRWPRSTPSARSWSPIRRRRRRPPWRRRRPPPHRHDRRRRRPSTRGDRDARRRPCQRPPPAVAAGRPGRAGAADGPVAAGAHPRRRRLHGVGDGRRDGGLGRRPPRRGPGQRRRRARAAGSSATGSSRPTRATGSSDGRSGAARGVDPRRA